MYIFLTINNALVLFNNFQWQKLVTRDRQILNPTTVYICPPWRFCFCKDSIIDKFRRLGFSRNVTPLEKKIGTFSVQIDLKDSDEKNIWIIGHTSRFKSTELWHVLFALNWWCLKIHQSQKRNSCLWKSNKRLNKFEKTGHNYDINFWS